MRANLLNVLASERCGGGNRVDRRNDVASVTAERCGVGSHLGSSTQGTIPYEDF